MKYLALFVAAGLAAVFPRVAAAQPHMDLVKQAIAAMGGEEAIRGLKTLAVRGDTSNWEPDQSVVAAAAPRFLGDSSFTINWDIAGDMMRTEWLRVMQYPASRRLSFTEVVAPKYGFVQDDKGVRPMSGIRVATQLREIQRISPWLLLRMASNPSGVSAEGGIRVGNALVPAASFKEGATTFVVMFDRKTHLPLLVRTTDDEPMRGTSFFDVKLDDWKPVGQVLLPRRFTGTIADIVVARTFFREVIPNPVLDESIFAAPDSIKTVLRPPAAGPVPFQWVLRQLYLGLFLDSDQVFVPPGGSLKLVELAPNVQQVVGGSHNSLIVALKDGLVVFDAPVGEAQSRWTIDAAKAKYGKPVKYLVLTHHHRDHAAGVRTYMAEGAKIIVPAPDQKYFAKVALTQHVIPDEFQKKRISADVVEVKDDMTIKDDGSEVRLYQIKNPHVDGMLIGHVLPSNIVWVTDLYSPGNDSTRTAGNAALLDALKKLGIVSATIAGGQGGAGPQADLERIAAGP